MKRISLLALIIALFAMASVAAAQDATRTVTLEEAQINAHFEIITRTAYTVENIVVDLRPGDVVIDADVTFGVNSESPRTFATTTTMVPTVTAGLVEWTITAVVVDGTTGSEDVVSRLNSIIASSWRRWFREEYGPHRVQSIAIDETTITYVIGERQNDNDIPRPDVDIEDGIATMTISEERLNATYRVSGPRNFRMDILYVDALPGQIELLVNFEVFRGDPTDVVITLVPRVVDGDLVWDTMVEPVNDVSLPAEVTEQLGTAAANAAANLVGDGESARPRPNRPDRTYTAVSVTDDALIISFEVEGR